MKKLITGLFALLWAVGGLAQTFPVQNLQVLGTSNLAGTVSGTGVTALFNSPPAIGSVTPSTGAFTNLSATTPPSLSNGFLYPTVANNTALKALATTSTGVVTRLGFASSGDSTPVTYQASAVACPLNSGAGDNGSQVQSADSKCWLAVFPSTTVDVKIWGAAFNGSTDDTAAFQAAIAYLQSLPQGGTLSLPSGNTLISSTIVINSPLIQIVGKGHGSNHDAGTGANGSTVISWGGGAAAMFFIGPVASSARALSGNAFTGIFLNGNSSASYGVYVLSSRKGVYDFAGQEFTQAMMYIGCQTGLSEAADSQQNLVSLYGRELLNSGYTLQIDGISNANTSFNVFQIIQAQYKNAPAIYVGSADNNTFISTQLTEAGGGTASAGILLDASAFTVAASSNMFIDCSPGNAGVYSAGTERNTTPSLYNSILFYDKGNGPPNPVTGTGVIFYWASNYKGSIGNRLDTLTSGANWFVDSNGRFHVYALTASIPANSTGTFTIPSGITISTGVQSIQLTPHTNSISTYSAQYAGGTTININNGSGTATDFYIDVTGF